MTDEPLQRLTFRIERFDRNRLKLLADQRGKKPTAIVRELVERYLDSVEAGQQTERNGAAPARHSNLRAGQNSAA